MQPEVLVQNDTVSFEQTEAERRACCDQLSEDGKKIARTLDQHLHKDILFFKNNNVMLRLRLGNKVIAEYPIHCEIENDEVIIYEYAGSKSNKRREE